MIIPALEILGPRNDGRLRGADAAPPTTARGRADVGSREARFPRWALVGAAVFALGLQALVRDVPVWNAVWYLPAWYGYLLVLDALLFRLRGYSLVSNGARQLLPLMFWSLPFWVFFEAYNLRIQNWWYVFVLRSPAAGALAGAVAFATVLPACLLHAEVVRELAGGFARRRGPRLRMTPALRTGTSILGIGAAILPLLFPRYAFWAVWFIPFLLAEPSLSRSGGPSLLADLDTGSWARLVSLLLGGLWAGVVWELFNFWARSKWLYTVPAFEHPKLFEMPIVGYLGFPPLAISAFSFVSWLSWLAQRAKRGAQPRHPLLWAGAAALLFSGVTLSFVLVRTVVSQRPVLAELAGLDTASVGKVRAAGIATPELLVRAVERRGIDTVARAAALDPDVVRRATREASLALHKGMGIENARLFERAGIEDVATLSRCDSRDAVRRLAAAASPGERVPSPALVRLWIDAAKPGGKPRR